MKKFFLPALVMVFLFGLIAVGVLVYKKSGNRRFAAEKGEEIKIKNEKLKIKDGKAGEGSDVPEWVGKYILTPGPVKNTVRSGKQLTSVNGRFKSLEPVPNSKDKYLVLSGVPENFSKLRVIYTPKPSEGIKRTTQVNLIVPKKDATTILETIRQIGTVDTLSNDELNLALRPGILVKAMFYQGDSGPIKDETGTYYVIAITTLEK